LRRSEACRPNSRRRFRVGLGFLEPAFALFGDGADELLVAVSDDLLGELSGNRDKLVGLLVVEAQFLEDGGGERNRVVVELLEALGNG
jgi:hypothetical protein